MALTKRYVRADAAGGGNGTTTSATGPNCAFTWAEFITNFNTRAAGGYKYIPMSIGGAFSNGTTTTTLTGDGTTTSPLIIEGCYQTEGDLLAQGFTATGLDVTNFPTVSYTGTTARFNAVGAAHAVVRCLSITSAASNPTVAISHTGAALDSCYVKNTGTNSLSSCVTGGIVVSNCDIETASTGAAAAIIGTANDGLVQGNRIKCTPGSGLSITTNYTTTAHRNLFVGCTRGIGSTGNVLLTLLDNTINACTTGIDVHSSTTQYVRICGNSITNSTTGIHFNGATCLKMMQRNRFRNNTTDVNGGGDWEEATSVGNVTGGSDAADWTSSNLGDYTLLTTAPGVAAGTGYRNPMGAFGPGSFSGGTSKPSHPFFQQVID